MNDGSIAAESIQVTTITPTLIDKAPQTTQSSGFTSGKVVNRIKYDSSDNTIKSIHTFKPDENFLQTDYNWVLYIKEQVNKDLIPYIDPSSVKIYVSDAQGVAISSDRYVNGTIDSNGFFDSSTISSISIKQTNTASQLDKARSNLDHNIFYGTLGQSRSYTIQYKLKDGYNLENIASQLSDRETFQSWLETDYLDTTDNGSANKRLLGSYASSYIDVVDRIAPVAPKANNITTQDTAITGTAEANTTITLNFSDGRKLTGTADSTGNFSVSVPSDFVLTGKETISITSTDKGLNISPAITISVTDTTPPTVTAISDKTQEVNTALNNIVINATDNSGDIVTNTVSGLPSGVTYNSSTNTISGTPTKVGNYPITIISKDTNGNTTTEFTITVIDTTAPVLDKIPNQTKEVNTPIDTITINGIDNSNRPVKNEVSGLPEGVTFDSESNTISGTPTIVGEYPIRVVTIDEEGNETTTEFTITVVDTTAPKVPTINPVKEGSKEINGQAEPGSTVEITFPDGQTVKGQADDDGNYHIEVPTDEHLKGGNHISATSTDKAGNTSKETTITVVDTTAPKVPTINPVKEGSKEINGQAEPGSTVVITFPDGQTVKGQADDDGNYHIEVPTDEHLKGGNHISATSTDKAGNTSKETTITVVDTTAPKAPTINPVKEGSKEISGQAEPGSTVEITFPDGQTARGQADDDGNYHIEVPTDEHLKSGDHISATSTDKAGNMSEPTDVIVESSHKDGNDNNSDDSNHHNGNNPKPDNHAKDSNQNNGNHKNPEKPNKPKYSGHHHGDLNSNIPSDSKDLSDHHLGQSNHNENIVHIGKGQSIQNNSQKDRKKSQPNYHQGNEQQSIFETNDTSNIRDEQRAQKQRNQSKTNYDKNNKTHDLPETGEEKDNKGILFSSLFAGLGALFLLFKRRKKMKMKKSNLFKNLLKMIR